MNGISTVYYGLHKNIQTSTAKRDESNRTDNINIGGGILNEYTESVDPGGVYSMMEDG